MSDFVLAAERLHFAWDNSLPPVLEIDPATRSPSTPGTPAATTPRATSTSADAGKRRAPTCAATR